MEESHRCYRARHNGQLVFGDEEFNNLAVLHEFLKDMLGDKAGECVIEIKTEDSSWVTVEG